MGRKLVNQLAMLGTGGAMVEGGVQGKFDIVVSRALECVMGSVEEG